MSKTELPEFNHYQHSAPEYTEEVLWHRVYAVVAAALLVVAVLGWGIYAALKDEPEAFSVDALAPTAALPPAVQANTDIAVETDNALESATENTVVEANESEEPNIETGIIATTLPENTEPVAPSTEPAPAQKPIVTASGESPSAESNDFAVKLKILSADITDAALTDHMQGLEPADKLTSTENLQDGFLKLYFYTDLEGHAGDTLIYSWYRNEKRVAKVRIPVGSDRWRSHSSKNLSANMRGDWKVVVTDRKSNTLATAEFYLK